MIFPPVTFFGQQMQFLSSYVSNKLIADNTGRLQFPADDSGGVLSAVPGAAGVDALLSITTCSSNSWLGGQGSIVWTVQEGQCNTIILSNMKSQYLLLN